MTEKLQVCERSLGVYVRERGRDGERVTETEREREEGKGRERIERG